MSKKQRIKVSAKAVAGVRLIDNDSKPDNAKAVKEGKKAAGKATRGQIVNIAVCGGLLAAVSITLLVVQRPTVSTIENRSLNVFPEFSFEELFGGGYTDGITDWYNDTVPARDELKKLGSNIRALFGVTPSSGETFGNIVKVTQAAETPAPVITEPAEIITEPAATTDTAQGEAVTTAPVTEQTTETTTAAPAYDPANEIADGVMTNGQIVVYQDGHYRGISLYGGGTGENYAKYVNSFKADLGDSVNVYSMVVPTSGAYYTPLNYAEYNASHKETLESIRSKLDGVIDVDVYDVLRAHIDEEIYTRTDHHWQPLGAYYATQAFAEAAGVPFTDLTEYKPVIVDGYMGTLYSYTQSANLLNDPEQFVFYKPTADYTAYYYKTDYTLDEDVKYYHTIFVDQPVSQSYSTFMGGDKKIVRIETSQKNGRKLCVFKDSYGNAEIPFYLGSFEEVYVCDMRYFDTNAVEFIKQEGITDVLFTMCTFSAVGENAENLEVIRTQ